MSKGKKAYKAYKANEPSLLPDREEVKKASYTISPAIEGKAASAAASTGYGAFAGLAGAAYGGFYGVLLGGPVGAVIGAATVGSTAAIGGGVGMSVGLDAAKTTKKKRATDIIERIGYAVASGEQEEIYAGLEANKRGISSADRNFYATATDLATKVAKDNPSGWQKEWKGIEKQLTKAIDIDNSKVNKGFENAARQLQANCIMHEVPFDKEILNFGLSNEQAESKNAPSLMESFTSMFTSKKAPEGYAQAEEKEKSPKKQAYTPPTVPTVKTTTKPEPESPTSVLEADLLGLEDTKVSTKSTSSNTAQGFAAKFSETTAQRGGYASAAEQDKETKNKGGYQPPLG